MHSRHEFYLGYLVNIKEFLIVVTYFLKKTDLIRFSIKNDMYLK